MNSPNPKDLLALHSPEITFKFTRQYCNEPLSSQAAQSGASFGSVALVMIGTLTNRRLSPLNVPLERCQARIRAIRGI